MAQNFGKIRNVELSTVYAIRTAIDAVWSDVTTVVGYPDFTKPQTLPIVSVRLANDNADFLEIGSRQTIDEYDFIIDIFAKSDPQRMDLAQTVKNTLLGDWTYYEHSRTSGQGASDITRTADGKVQFRRFIQNTHVEIGGRDVDAYDRFRQLISFTVFVD